MMGNIKVVLPFLREKFTVEQEKIDNMLKDRYRKCSQAPLKEKRIFGVMTAHQVGYIPNLQLSFTEDEENF